MNNWPTHLKDRWITGSHRILPVLLLLLFITLLPAQPTGRPLPYPWEASPSETGGGKCGFPAILNAALSHDPTVQSQYRAWNRAHTTAQAMYLSPTGHFKIYYDTTGYHAIPTYDRNGNGTPDYLEFVANAFDRAWLVEVDTLQFQPPPDSTGAARTVYPIYCKRIRDYGQTVLDYRIPVSGRTIYTTHIVINTNFSFIQYPGVSDPIVRDSMAIAVTAAHEFNHALQSGYNLWSDQSGTWFYDIWFIESSAVYMEELVADAVNDYLNYLSDYFRVTARPLDEDRLTLADYGKVPFEIMLGKLFGRNITRRIWEKIVQYRATEAIEHVLQEEGTSLTSVFPHLAEWLYYIGPRANPNFFPDASLFPSLPADSLEPISFSQPAVVQDSLPRLSFRYYRGVTHLDGEAIFLLKPDQSTTGVNLYGIFENFATNRVILLPASTPFTCPQPDPGTSLRFAGINASFKGEEATPFQIQVRPAPDSTEQTIRVFPQPVRLSSSQAVLTFHFPATAATVHIFTASGKPVRTLHLVNTSPGNSWNLRNERGELVHSGVYLYRLKTETQEFTGKIMVIH